MELSTLLFFKQQISQCKETGQPGNWLPMKVLCSLTPWETGSSTSWEKDPPQRAVIKAPMQAASSSALTRAQGIQENIQRKLEKFCYEFICNKYSWVTWFPILWIKDLFWPSCQCGLFSGPGFGCPSRPSSNVFSSPNMPSHMQAVRMIFCIYIILFWHLTNHPSSFSGYYCFLLNFISSGWPKN